MNQRKLDEVSVIVPEIHEDLIALNAALDRLKTVDPKAVELVHLRYFAGLTLAEAAKMLEIYPRMADRVWAFGTVMKAFDEKLQRVVAIKILAPKMAAISPARKRFL